MAKSRSKHFSVSFFLLIAIASTFAAPAADTAGAPDSSSVQVTESADMRVELSKKAAVDGSIVLARIQLKSALASTPTEDVRVEFADREIPCFPDTEKGAGAYGAVVPIPHSFAPGETQIVFRAGRGASAKTLNVPIQIQDGHYKSEVLKVDPRHVSPPKRYAARIARESRLVGHLYDRMTRIKYWKGPFALPIRSDVTSPFGGKRLYNGEQKNYHGGLDLKAAVGTPIVAAAGGEVVMAQFLYYTGNTVIIDHGYGVFTVYAHMSKMRVKVGDVVTAQQLLGKSGVTGRVTGPHLHWQTVVRRVKVNPWEFTEVMQ